MFGSIPLRIIRFPRIIKNPDTSFSCQGLYGYSRREQDRRNKNRKARWPMFLKQKRKAKGKKRKGRNEKGSFIHSWINSFMYPWPFHKSFTAHSFMYSLIESFVGSFIPSCIHSFFLSFFHLFIHSCTHPSILSFMHSFTHSLIDSRVGSLSGLTTSVLVSSTPQSKAAWGSWRRKGRGEGCSAQPRPCRKKQS